MTSVSGILTWIAPIIVIGIAVIFFWIIAWLSKYWGSWGCNDGL